jgi:hypothetical protein
VRLHPRADGTRIDARSSTRFGDRDYGQNADHIHRLDAAVPHPAAGPVGFHHLPLAVLRRLEGEREGRKWQVVESYRPGGRVGNGRIEAVVRSRLLGLPYDSSGPRSRVRGAICG